HTRLAPGGILIFLTGQKAIEERKKRQSKSLIRFESRKPYTTVKVNDETSIKKSELNTDTVKVEDVQLGKDTHDAAADVDEVPMYILPLYSLLPTEEQMKVFEDPPADSQLVVIATNVAETPLTIPNIRYVIDSGRAKERHYGLSSGIQSFEIDWISEASASQRSG
ncbi:uncharacterized protein MELLADRAFT_32280, partial [Melampsora larici-populina 98AG31]